MTRYGMVIGLKPEAEERYKEYHAAVWPGVLAMISKCNIRNYSIYLKDHMLYSYFEYHGDDYAADMAKMASDKTTQECAHRPHHPGRQLFIIDLGRLQRRPQRRQRRGSARPGSGGGLDGGLHVRDGLAGRSPGARHRSPAAISKRHLAPLAVDARSAPRRRHRSCSRMDARAFGLTQPRVLQGVSSCAFVSGSAATRVPPTTSSCLIRPV